MRLLLFVVLFVSAAQLQAQEKPPLTERDTTFYTKVDSLYREDQFYFSITYNRLQKTPPGFSQNGFSTGVNIGFLRDMPINKKRTFAVAAGFGLSYNKYHQNLKVSEAPVGYSYEIADGGTFSRNKMEQVFLDFPLEIRWRNSTPESHKFWRIYMGFKVRYLLLSKTKFVGDKDIVILNNDDFNKVQYGPYIAFGYNTWNFHAYYGLNSIFKSAAIGTEPVNMKTLNFGLMFYIL